MFPRQNIGNLFNKKRVSEQDVNIQAYETQAPVGHNDSFFYSNAAYCRNILLL